MINIDKYTGIKFKDKGRGFSGVDCWGLCLLVFEEEYGITGLPDFRNNYNNTADWGGIGECINREINNWIEIDTPQEGAVVVMRIKTRPHHVGICTGFQRGKAMLLHIIKGQVCQHQRLNSLDLSIEAMYKCE